MVKEVDWQTKIIKRLREEKAYAKKWATAYSVGVPDLITVIEHDNYGAVFIEVKLEKAWTKNTSRTIDLTPKQVKELNDLLDAGGTAVVVVVVYQAPTDVYVAVLPPPSRRDRLSILRDDLLEGAYRWQDKKSLSEFIINEVRK